MNNLGFDWLPFITWREDDAVIGGDDSSISLTVKIPSYTSSD